jgi:cysteinyl-tRNA synthetase
MAMLENDLDTPKALVAIEEFIDSVEAKELSDDKSIIETFIQFLDNALGLTLGTVPDISNDQKEVINTRNKARQEKDWPKSDELRDKLSQQGIGLSDTENGAVWFRL